MSLGDNVITRGHQRECLRRHHSVWLTTTSSRWSHARDSLVAAVANKSAMAGDLGTIRRAIHHRVVSTTRPGLTDADHLTVAPSHHDLHVHRPSVVLTQCGSRMVPGDEGVIDDPQITAVGGHRCEEFAERGHQVVQEPAFLLLGNTKENGHLTLRQIGT
jgi:hypothetical protein